MVGRIVSGNAATRSSGPVLYTRAKVLIAMTSHDTRQSKGEGTNDHRSLRCHPSVAMAHLFGDDDDDDVLPHEEEDVVDHHSRQWDHDGEVGDNGGMINDDDQVDPLDIEDHDATASHQSEAPLLMRFCPHDSSMLYPQVRATCLFRIASTVEWSGRTTQLEQLIPFFRKIKETKHWYTRVDFVDTWNRQLEINT
jgi:hypothetical protein